MTFLNQTMLFALAAAAIPILIHLFNRHKAKSIQWGAMQFLLASLVSRSRRILIEEIVLMALRCMLIALVVLAMARPFMPSRSALPPGLIVGAVLLAMMCAAVGAAMWSNGRVRWAMIGTVTLLIAGVISACTYEAATQEHRWRDSGTQRDIVIVIDGSMSMTTNVDGQSNFRRAVAEAKSLVSELGPSDAVSLIEAGPMPRAIIPAPTSNRAEVLAALNNLSPIGGSMRTLEALNQASGSLAEGHNPTKKIIIITDGQNIGWDLANDARWRFLAEGMKNFPSPPQIVCRTLGLPKVFDNAAIVDLTLSRQVIGTDRPVGIDVKVQNTGTTRTTSLTVDLTIDGKGVSKQQINEIQPGAAQTARFEHQFDSTGFHVVVANLLYPDQLAADNVATRVVSVIDKLPVLIVDGMPSAQPLKSAGALIDLALAPKSISAGRALLPETPADRRPKPRRAGVPETPAQSNSEGFLVQPKVISAPEFVAISDLSQYRAVILANVPQLPFGAARTLGNFVREGGGLLIAAGDSCRPDFYNTWAGAGGEMVSPCRLISRTSRKDPARISIKSLSHPALEMLAQSQSDLGSATIYSHWKLDTPPNDTSVRIGALFEDGDPLLVERKCGAGYVIVTALSLDAHDSDLPSLKSFVPLIHELAYYLAQPMAPAANVRPGAEVSIELPLSAQRDKVDAAAPLVAQGLEVLTPSGVKRRCGSSLGKNTLKLTFTGTDEPGLYHFLLPPGLIAARDKKTDKPSAASQQPFVVLDDGAESTLAALTQADFAQAAKYVNLVGAQQLAELLAAVKGDVPGNELWRWLAMAAALAMVLEIVLTRWIAMRRKSHISQPVNFGSRALDVKSFRDKAKQMLNLDDRAGAGSTGFPARAQASQPGKAVLP